MPTVTDTLETVFKVTGAAGLIGSLEAAAKATGNLAVAQSKAGSIQGQTAAGAGGLTNSLGALAGGWTGVALAASAALVALGKQALDVFAADEDAIFRTTVVLKNLGNSYPIEKAQAFASLLQKSIAVDDEAVVALIGLEKRFGIADSQIEKTTKTILDFSKGTGLSLEQAGDTVGRALLGQTRGLRALGMEFTATGDKAKDLATIQEKLNGLFGGAAEAQRNTLSGSVTALQESFNNLLSAIGDKLSVVLIPLLNALTKAIDFLTAHLEALGPAFAFLNLLPSRQNPAEQIGNGKARLATEDTLQDIAGHTKRGADNQDQVIQAVLGGSGTIARGAISARDLQMAFRV